jgi:hypothetical protein
MESARFWPFRTTIGGRRESSVFRYLSAPSPDFPFVYQNALSLVLAEWTFGFEDLDLLWGLGRARDHMLLVIMPL